MKMGRLLFVFAALFSFVLYVAQCGRISRNLSEYLWQFLIGSFAYELDGSNNGTEQGWIPIKLRSNSCKTINFF